MNFYVIYDWDSGGCADVLTKLNRQHNALVAGSIFDAAADFYELGCNIKIMQNGGRRYPTLYISKRDFIQR